MGAFAGGIPQGEGKAYGNSGRADSWGTYADGEFVAGQTVLYDENGKIQYRGEVSNGQYEGKGSLYADGELIVRKEDGTEEAVYAGEVSVRGVYGYV